MPGGTWSTINLPVRGGTYIDYINAAQAAVTPGTIGLVALVATADWGLENTPQQATNLADITSLYGPASYGALGQAGIDALDGMDDGGAQGLVLYRAVGSSGAKATLSLDDAATPTPAVALTISGFYKGARANNFTVVVQSNVTTPANRDYLLYENGRLLMEFLNRTSNTDAAAYINSFPGNTYITATAVGATRQVAPLLAGGALTAGDSGNTLILSDYSAAITALQNTIFDVVVLVNVSDGPTEDALVAWAETYNTSSGNRAFAMVGGAAAESPATAIARSYNPSAMTGDYDDPDTLNVGATDLLRLSDGVTLSTAQLLPRIAGAIAYMQISRNLSGVTLSGYRVVQSLSDATYSQLVQNGVICFRQNDPVTVSIEKGVTSQVTNNTATDETARPAGHQIIRNVAIDHFLSRLLGQAGNLARGKLPNNGPGRAGFLGKILDTLHFLEGAQAINPGSTVGLDQAFTTAGQQMFIFIGLTYLYTVEQFFLRIAVA